ncbi:MAG: hypothetical protein PHD48_05435 [Alphaproteobacteria bacterium]|nr:hypothetical protein [Alphaproteobacteria bacterium]
MTKLGLETMIAALKDRCKKSMDSHACMMASSTGDSPATCSVPSFLSICSDQFISLTALIAYVAQATGRSEYRVERDLSNHFCIPNPKCLPAHLYDKAVRFMVEQVPQNNC